MKAVVFLADGFEEVEALTVVDYLRRLEEFKVETVSISEDLKVRGAHDIYVIADKLITDLDKEDIDLLVIPGGMPGASNLRDDFRVIDIIRYLDEEEKLLAAICAGPIVFEKAGIVSGKKITSYPGFEDVFTSSNYSTDRVVKDGNIITARGPSIALDFTLEIIETLLGKNRAEDLMKDILY